MDKNPTHVCSLCSATFKGYGHNPEPLKRNEERCCDQCNSSKVIPARIEAMFGKAKVVH